ncbi:unnamed protein product [Hermetia illucens]|uniref:Uncharacterized protein n=1 Tax=Hermetia illucens TaxID=343691 RepID=A0A7R8YT30_HERIL|nr:unnamed protein product [Hermetia illucens]
MENPAFALSSKVIGIGKQFVLAAPCFNHREKREQGKILANTEEHLNLAVASLQTWISARSPDSGQMPYESGKMEQYANKARVTAQYMVVVVLVANCSMLH